MRELKSWAVYTCRLQYENAQVRGQTIQNKKMEDRATTGKIMFSFSGHLTFNRNYEQHILDFTQAAHRFFHRSKEYCTPPFYLQFLTHSVNEYS